MDVIFDIDGTLADCSHRLKWIQNKPKNWKAFYAGMENDTPIFPMVHTLMSLENDGNRIIFCTGRPEDYLEVTQEWILKHLLIDPARLYMRAKKDNRADDIVKEELLFQMREHGYNPVLAFEDRSRVVEMYRRNGLIVAQVAEGNF